jgi:hypothetical protein
LSFSPVSWFEIGLVKSAPKMTDGIPLQVKRLCVIERIRGTSKGLKTHAYWNSFANMLGVLDRPLPGNDFPNSNGASGYRQFARQASMSSHPSSETAGLQPRGILPSEVSPVGSVRRESQSETPAGGARCHRAARARRSAACAL